MIITKEMLKKFARYEIDGGMFYEDEYEIEEKYQVNLEDFRMLLGKLETIGNESFTKFDDEWFQYVYYMDDVSEALCLQDCVEGNWGTKEGLIKTDENLISYIMHEFEIASDECWDVEDASIAKMLDFSKINKVIADYESNKTKPLTEWEYPEDIKADFVQYVDRQEKQPEIISGDELALFKRYVEELIAKDNLTALRTKGYLCYGGSPFYECDWYTSRDCITRAFELTMDAGYANTLGYIYYYGRCNNGEPEYEKAFKYFTYGHANNWYESSYKLADMYRKGKGTFKSPETAKTIIEGLYNEAVEEFVRGQDKKFADVALRMGSIYEDEGEMTAAYHYYLQADYAIKKREKYDYYGDSTVRKGIQESLERIRTQIEPPVAKKTIRGDFRILNWLVGDGYACTAVVKQLKKGFKVNLKRIPKRYESVPELVLMTFPEYDFCGLTDEITIYSDREWNREELPESFTFTDYDIGWFRDGEMAEVEFTLFGKIVARIKGDYTFKLKPTKYDN